jgi:hypothetical protein
MSGVRAVNAGPSGDLDKGNNEEASYAQSSDRHR